MLTLGERRSDQQGWTPPVVKTVASRAEGVPELAAAIDEHRAWLVETGGLEARRRRRAAAEIEAIALGVLRVRIDAGSRVDDLAGQVVEGSLDPYAAADELVRGLTS